MRFVDRDFIMIFKPTSILFASCTMVIVKNIYGRLALLHTYISRFYSSFHFYTGKQLGKQVFHHIE